MDYIEFAYRMRTVPSAEGLLYEYSARSPHEKRLPYGIVSLGDFNGSVLKPPRRVVNVWGRTVPVNAVALEEQNEVTDLFLPGQSVIREVTLTGCAELRRLFLPFSVTRICAGAFRNCLKLEDVYYEGTPAK